MLNLHVLVQTHPFYQSRLFSAVLGSFLREGKNPLKERGWSPEGLGHHYIPNASTILMPIGVQKIFLNE